MKNIKLYELEETYRNEESSLEYPTVSYTKDTDKVWYVEKNQIKMVFSITEDDVNSYGGEMMDAWSNLYMFDSVTVDGVEQVNASKYDVNVGVQDGDEFKLTDESFIPRTIVGLKINFNEPLNQDSNIAFAFHEKWEDDGEYSVYSWIETLDDINEYYNYSIMTTQDGCISSIIIDRVWEYTESSQLGISVHTYADDEDPYELIPSKDNIIDINIKYTSKNLYLYLPTTEARNYEVVATRYGHVTSMYYMFRFCKNLTFLDLSSFDTSNVTDMSGMFSWCSSLTSMTQVIGFENLDTSKVTKMDSMFSYCASLTSLDLSSFDTSNVTDMHEMFSNCTSLTSIDLSSFDTSNVTDMRHMFANCSELASLDLSGWDSSNVTNMSYMFNKCSGLTSLDLSNFNTSNVTNMTRMFDSCHILTSIDLSSFNTSNVSDMYGMFYNCTSLTLITFGSQADISKVTNYLNMFRGITTTGTLYYPSEYANAWNNILITNRSTSNFPSTWTPTSVDYENGRTVPMSE